RPRPEDRGKRRAAGDRRVVLAGFNPPPARRPGETRGGSPCRRPAARFQPAPGPKTGGNLMDQTARAGTARFNPPPARRPGETAILAGAEPDLHEFQPAPGPKTGGNKEARAVGALVNMFQPAPGPKTGGNSRPGKWCCCKELQRLFREPRFPLLP